MQRLYHYTCSHGARRIKLTGELRPFPQPLLGGKRLLWLTDMDVADPEALGLTSDLLDCDRTEHRFVVITGGALPWSQYANVVGVPVDVRSRLEDGREPSRWFVSLFALPLARAVV